MNYNVFVAEVNRAECVRTYEINAIQSIANEKKISIEEARKLLFASTDKSPVIAGKYEFWIE